MFSLSTSSQSLASSSSNTTNYYGFLSMAIEAMSYWITGSNPQVSAEVEHSIQQTISEEIEIEWESDHEHLRGLTGSEGTEFQVNTYSASTLTKSEPLLLNKTEPPLFFCLIKL